MKKLFIITSMLIPALLFAGSNGGYAGSFLRMGLGARSLAMGNTGIADQAGGYSFYYNPALTAFTEKKTVSLSNSSMSLDRSTNFIGFSMKAPPDAGFALGWMRSAVDELYQINSIGEFGDQIDHSINAVYFNFARPFGDKLAIGLSFKYVWESIDAGDDAYFSSGWGWDFGAIYQILPQLRAGFVVRDIATQFRASTDKIFEHGGTTTDDFPMVYLAGLRYDTPLSWLHVQYDFETSDKNASAHHLGAEAVYNETVALRVGFESGKADSRLTMGAGINFRALEKGENSLLRFLGYLDYAFLPSILDEGSSHVFSWQFYID